MQQPDTQAPRPLFIGLCGMAGSGKDTVADHLIAAHDFVGTSFAAPLRTMVAALLEDAGQPQMWLHDRRLKEQPVPVIGHSARRLLQVLGTEAGRSLDPGVWVRLCALRLGLPYGASEHHLNAPINHRLVITDVRFPNEAQFITDSGGYLVHVVRDTQPLRGAAGQHASEQGISGLQTHFRIYNHRGFEELYAEVDSMLQQITRLGDFSNPGAATNH